MDISNIIEKWQFGDYLCDDELIILRDQYTGVINAVHPFGQYYMIVKSDAMQNVNIIEQFMRARGMDV